MYRRGILKAVGGIGALVSVSQQPARVAAEGVSVQIVETNEPVQAGDFLDIVAHVENTSESNERPELEFFIGDDRKISRTTTINAGESATLKFSHRTFPVREAVEFPVSVDDGENAAERVVEVRGIDELDAETYRPAREITISPGTTVLFEIESDILDEYGGRTHWYVEGEYSGWSHGPWNWSFYETYSADHWRQTFESEGTYGVAATVDGDDENYTARWTVEVAADAADAPTVEAVDPDPGPLELSSTETVELQATVTDPSGNLDRVVWWLGHADRILGVSDLDGANGTASISTDELCHGCPILVWVINDHGTVTEEHVWTPKLTYDGQTRVKIVETNDPVEAGARLEVVAEVENTATGEGTETLELVVGDEEVDRESVTLGAGGTETVTLGYDTYPVKTDVTFPVVVRSEHDRDSQTVDVLPAVGPTELTILETSDPVRAGDPLEVEVEVTNTESATVTEAIHLVAGDRVDSESVTLGADESEQITLGYETYPVQVDVEFPIEVYGDGNRDSQPVRVFADEIPPVSVSILETNDPVGAGDPLDVTAAIENTSDTTITEDVSLIVGGEQVDSASVTLTQGETTQLELGYETYPVERDVEFVVTVASNGVADEHSVEVVGTDSAQLAVTNVETNDPIDPGAVLEVVVGVENVGEAPADGGEVVTLRFDGAAVASDEVPLDAGESTEVTFAVESSEDDGGERDISIRTPHDEVSRTVTIGESPDPTLEVVDYHILGNDPDDEYVVIRNAGDETLDMSGWVVEDDHRVGVNLSALEFPDGFTLEPGAEVTIVSGSGDNTAETLYWGIGNQIWNQEDGDVVSVRNTAGDVVLEQPIGTEPDDDQDEDELADPTALELIDYDILGDDPDEEYITLRNTADEPLDTSDLRIEDDGLVPAGTLSPFEFNEFTLEAGAEVTLVTGQGNDTDETVYWGVGRHVWNEDGDIVYVRDGDGTVVLEEPIAAEEADDEPEAGPVTVVIDDTNTPVKGGEQLGVLVNLANNGTAETTATVELIVGDEVVDSESVLVPGEATQLVELGYSTYPVEQDVTFDVVVRTADDSESTTVEVFGTDDADETEDEEAESEPEQDETPEAEPDDSPEEEAESDEPPQEEDDEPDEPSEEAPDDPPEEDPEPDETPEEETDESPEETEPEPEPEPEQDETPEQESDDPPEEESEPEPEEETEPDES